MEYKNIVLGLVSALSLIFLGDVLPSAIALELEESAPKITSEQAAAISLNDIKETEKGFEISNRRYRASFDEAGMSFERRPASLTWNWSLEGVYLAGIAGERQVEVLQEVNPLREGRMSITYDRGTMRERYTALPNALEQEFIIPRPLGVGDLVIRGRVESAGIFSEQEGNFAWSHNEGVISFSKLKVYDASGEVIPAVLEAKADSTEIRIDGAALRGAQYPLVIDPEIGTNDFRVSDMGPDGNVNFNAATPSVAYNSSNNEYLVVWGGDDDTAPLVDGEVEIFGQRINGTTGAEIGSNDFRISDMGMDGDVNFGAVTPSVAYNSSNNEYLVVWAADDTTNGEIEIFGQRLNAANGAGIGANDFRISDMGLDGMTVYDASRPEVAYNSSNNEYLVVWEGDDDTPPLMNEEFEIFGQRIDGATGAEIGTNDFRISDMGPDGNVNFGALISSVAYNSSNNEYLVVWQGEDDTPPLVESELEIFGQRISGATGAEVGINDFRISDMGPDASTTFSAQSPSIAYNVTNNEYLVVWAGQDNTPPLVTGEFEIFGQRMNGASGAEIGTNDFRISDVGPDGDIDFDAFNPSVAYNSSNNEYLVIWQGDDNAAPLVDNEGEVFGQKISGATGAEIGSNDFRLSDMGPDGNTNFGVFSSALASNSSNTQYLVVWEGHDDTAPLVDFEAEIFGQIFGDVADLALVKSDSLDPAAAGHPLTYTLSVTNNGPDAAPNIEVSDPLPAGVSFTSATGTGWNCSESAGIVTCNIASLAASVSSDITLDVLVDNATLGNIDNSAIVSSPIFDGQSGDNMDTESTTVVAASCSLKVFKNCKKKVPSGTQCKVKSSITQDGAPLAGAVYSLKRKKGNSFEEFKKPKGGVTGSAGSHTLKFKIKKTKSYRSEFSSLPCTTNEVKIRVQK